MSDRDDLCGSCGAALPDGALFCGECGRAVTPAVLAPARALERCDHCGAAMDPDDIFCGECGNVAGSISRAFAAGRDTAVIEPIAPTDRLPDLDPPPALERPPTRDDVRSSLSDRMKRPVEPRSTEPGSIGPRPIEPLANPARPTDADARDGRRPHPQHAADTTTDTNADRDADADHADVEATRIVPPRGRGDRFVLQFSTGESVTVYGTGLIGRNPIPEPGEYFDQLVRVFDPTRSVSKTHLEFGQDGGAFWVRDRYSGNGTIVREPDSRPMRCDPGKRYPIMRGGRIDLGEQFVVVS